MKNEYTIVVPIHGKTPYLDRCLRSIIEASKDSCKQYFFCLESSCDYRLKEVSIVRNIMKDYDDLPIGVYYKKETYFKNPKIANIHKCWKDVITSHVLFIDSNVWLYNHHIKETLKLSESGYDIISSPPILVNDDLACRKLEASFINHYQMFFLKVADYFGNGFVHGKFVWFAKKDFPHLYYFNNFAGEDDGFTQGARIAKLKIKLLSKPVYHYSNCKTFREVIDRQLRWYNVRKRDYFWWWVFEPLTIFYLWPINGYSLIRTALIPILWTISIFQKKVLWYGKEV